MVLVRLGRAGAHLQLDTAVYSGPGFVCALALEYEYAGEDHGRGYQDSVVVLFAVLLYELLLLYDFGHRDARSRVVTLLHRRSSALMFSLSRCWWA